ncbi:MAG: hypothetical protein JO368_07495, partial [Acidimicrobiales bacterium]|nr:hypothetical protein [Acidimicrobiales bacterium]
MEPSAPLEAETAHAPSSVVRRHRLRTVMAGGVLVGVASLLVVTLTAGGGSPAGAGSDGNAEPTPVAATGTPPTGPVQGGPSTCDPLDPTQCLLPFPDDYFTVRAATPTGRRVAFPLALMPRNVSGVPIDPTAFDRNDGFSPGTPLLVHVPGLDLQSSGIAPITDIGASLRPDAPIVILDARTGQRVAYWAELDANDPDPSEQALIIHAAADYHDGDRYVVGLRDLRDGQGNVIPPGPVFRAYRDGTPLPTAAEAQRRAHLNAVMDLLGRAGVDRQSLYLAWDFTVASAQSITGPMLHMRDTAFAQLGSSAPSFSVASVTDYTPAENTLIARHVSGTFSVPSFLDQPGGPPGSTFNLGPDGLPAQIPGNVQTANFECNVPRTTVADSSSPGSTVYPAHPMLYGHGLLGSADEIDDPHIEQEANAGNFVTCATDWLGLSQADVPTDAHVITELSAFPTIPDRGDQAMLDALFLGRLLTSPAGFATSPAFQVGGSSLLEPGAPLVYYGNSQGGIQGGALTAVSQEFTRAVLGVPGMDYSLLLNRSVDFAPFAAVMNLSYPDRLVQQIAIALIQMLWDRSEADGYAAFMTDDPLPGTPPHRVLLEEAFGDFQVANIATETEARTIGASVHQPALAPGRSPDVQPLYGIPALP